MIDLKEINKTNQRMIGHNLTLDNILSIEFRADLQKNKLVDNDFSVFFAGPGKDLHLRFINRIKDGQIKEYYLTDWKKLQKNKSPEKITEFDTNIEGKDLITFIRKCPDINGFRINNNTYNNNYNSVDINNNHEDTYFYNWWSNQYTRPLFLVNKKWYTKNYMCEILRYDIKTLELNKIYICHNYYLKDIYPYSILKNYSAWQVFYYFTPDNLDEPKECLFDPRIKNPNTRKLLKHYLGISKLKNWSDPDTKNFSKISLNEADWFWNSVENGQDVDLNQAYRIK